LINAAQSAEFVDTGRSMVGSALVSSCKLNPRHVGLLQLVREPVAANTPWDRRAATGDAKGSTLENAANFMSFMKIPRKCPDDEPRCRHVGRCAKRHNHPLEKRTNNQYGMANLFARAHQNAGGEGNSSSCRHRGRSGPAADRKTAARHRWMPKPST
jgi:hypothetical protein